MLEQIDLSKSIDKKEYEEITDDLKIKLGELQRKAWKMEIPIIIVFEGWHAAGMTDVINRFLMPLNPMGFELYTTGEPCVKEMKKPLLWRFWTKIPKKGSIAIFDRSWYRRAIIEHFVKGMHENDMEKCLNGMKFFERQLTDDGYLIIKFFLHVSQERQRERFESIRKKNLPLFLVEEEGKNYLDNYDEYFHLIERSIEITDTHQAPWTIVEAEDLRFATAKVMAEFVKTLEEKIEQKENENEMAHSHGNTNCAIPGLNSSVLKNVDLTKSISIKEYRKKRKNYQKRLVNLQYELFKQKKPVMIVFEGWDAAGKGGDIRRLVEKLNPRLYRVVPIGAPSDYELSHHYLWRFYNEIPEAGHTAIYDRSWYGRILVERVEDLCGRQEWKRAYREINEFEETLSNYGMIIIKFWLHIDKDEQLRRFEEREKTAHKKWKITPDDWRNRDMWSLYEGAVDEMLHRTSTTYAPWTIVESNNKHYSRIKVLETVVERLEKELGINDE